MWMAASRAAVNSCLSRSLTARTTCRRRRHTGRKIGSLPATLAKSIAPEWISFPNSGSNGFGTSFEIGSLAASLKATTGWSIVGHKKVDGHAAVGVKGSDGEVLWIAASGTPYPILDSKKGSGGGTVTFGGWNSFKLPKAPKKAIALSSLRS
jgi:hypothetical protein